MENYIEFKFDQEVLTGVPSVAIITEALRDLICTALQERYNKKSYTGCWHAYQVLKEYPVSQKP
jgi:hypothetical protein